MDAAPARVIVFAPSEEAARAAAEPLRAALWSQHTLSVLLPSGAEPVKALTAFRDRHASLLLATPAASRGLDLPGVSHVFCLGAAPDAREYLHRAGRAGRLGSTTGGIVTSIVAPGELAALQAQAAELGVEVQVLDGTSAANVGMAPLLDAMSAIRLPADGDKVEGVGGDAGDSDEVAAAPALDADQVEALRKALDDRFNLM